MKYNKNILQAIQQIKNKEISYRKASVKYNIPKTTLFSLVHSKDPTTNKLKGIFLANILISVY